MTREELYKNICPSYMKEKCAMGESSCEICRKVLDMLFDRYEHEIKDKIYSECGIKINGSDKLEFDFEKVAQFKKRAYSERLKWLGL